MSRLAGWTSILVIAVVGMGCGSKSKDGNNNNNNNEPFCGNGALDPGEDCDATDFGGHTCISHGFLAGTLNCTPSLCTIDTGGCTDAVCGNGQLDQGEACDGAQLNNETCEGLGYASGTLSCTQNCQFDESECVPLGCGDGIITAPEECDDGDNLGHDGCGILCAVEEGWECTGEPSVCNEICGDGIIIGSEGCDDGNQDNSDDCPDDGANGGTCLTAYCGDGHLWTGHEVCDDGNTTDGDGCKGDCLSDETCGNWLLDSHVGEVCDDGFTDACGTCNADCTAAGSGFTCGDGAVCPEFEVCDDNNTADCDGCKGDCSRLDNICGDSTVDSTCGEQCDGVNMGGATCSDFNLPGVTPSCDASCNLVLDPCKSCDRWSLIVLDQPDDSQVTLDLNLFEYRVEPDNSLLYIRVTAASTYDPTSYDVEVRLTDGATGIVMFEDDHGVEELYYWDTNISDWAVISATQFAVDRSGASWSGELFFTVPMWVLETYLPALNPFEVYAAASINDQNLGTVDEMPATPARVDWSERSLCDFTIPSSPDPKGDASTGIADYGVIAYNGENGEFKVRMVLYTPINFTIANREAHVYLANDTDTTAIALMLAPSEVYFSWWDGNWSAWTSAPFSCVPSPSLATTSTNWVITCPQAALETASGGVFDFDPSDTFRMGGLSSDNMTPVDDMPDGWSGTSMGALDLIQFP